jgi:hypothetical protein
LLNSDIFGYNPLPSGTFRQDNDEAPSLLKDSQLRQRKLDVLNMQDGLKSDIKRLQLESERSDDETARVCIRESQVVYYAFSAKWP